MRLERGGKHPRKGGGTRSGLDGVGLPPAFMRRTATAVILLAMLAAAL